MRAIVITICILLALGSLGSICHATVIFSSKWDNADSGKSGNSGSQDDGGAWHYAYVASGNITLNRVSGDQSAYGGPTGPPPLAPNTTYYLQQIWIPDGSDCQVYLQAGPDSNFGTQTDLYMGMWFYFNRGMTFIDSVKWMDFRTSYQAVGNGHLALFGFNHGAWYCANTTYADAGYTNYGQGWGNDGTYHYLTALKYLSQAGGENVLANNDGNYNFYDVSGEFDSNLDTNGNAVGYSGYNAKNVNRIQISGGAWYAMIVHAKIDSTNGVMEAWIKQGSNPLYKVMKWDKTTAWVNGGGTAPYFYTQNGTGAIDHIQINAYWNGWPKASGTRYMWFSNVIVATTLAEVENYLGVSGINPPTSPSAPSALKITAP